MALGPEGCWVSEYEKSNVRLRSWFSFCRNNERNVREPITNVKRILTCSIGPKRRKTRVVKEVELFSESVKMGGEGFRVGRSLSSSSGKCEQMDLCDNESNDENSSLLFLLGERCATPRKDKFSYLSPFEALSVSGRERRRIVEGRRTKRAEALRQTLGRNFASSCRKWWIFRHSIRGEWWRQDTWWWRRMARSAMPGKRRSTMKKA